jgi:hypothetical protein
VSIVELRDPTPPSRGVRLRCALTFGVFALIGVSLYRTLIPASSAQWWYLWPLTVLTCASVGANRGPSIHSEILTKSILEASVRAFFIFAEGIVWSVLGTMVLEGVELGVTTDVLGGILKLAIVLPFGPLVGVLAVLYTLWVTVPLAIVSGSVVFRLLQRDPTPVDPSPHRAQRP